MEISKEELAVLIETAVEKAVGRCNCPFNQEEVQTLRDVAMGGKTFKQIIIYAVIGFILVGVGVKVFK